MITINRIKYEKYMMWIVIDVWISDNVVLCIYSECYHPTWILHYWLPFLLNKNGNFEGGKNNNIERRKSEKNKMEGRRKISMWILQTKTIEKNPQWAPTTMMGKVFIFKYLCMLFIFFTPPLLRTRQLYYNKFYITMSESKIEFWVWRNKKKKE